MDTGAYTDSEDDHSLGREKQMMQGRVEMTGREKSLKMRKWVWLELKENTLALMRKGTLALLHNCRRRCTQVLTDK